jgi:hypothetical protein
MNGDILKIVAPWIAVWKEKKEADSKKMETLLAILPPEQVDSWTDDLHNAYYRRSEISLQDQYRIFRDRSDTKFFRGKLQKKFNKFNKSFNELTRFLGTYFFVNPNNLDFYVLYEELQREDPPLYAKRLKELQELVIKFDKDYRDLVECGSEKYVDPVSSWIALGLLVVILVGAAVKLF